MNLHRMILVSSVAAAFLAVLPGTGNAAQTDDRVEKLISESRAALGGNALDRIKVLQVNAKLSVGGLPGTGTTWQEIGGTRFAESYNTPPLIGGDGYDGTDAWNKDGSGLVWVDGGFVGRAQEIGEAFIADYQLWSPDHGGAIISWGGDKSDAGQTYDSLTIIPRGTTVPVEIWFDRSTHLPVRVAQTIGPNSSFTTYSNYKLFNGLMLARTQHNESSDGNKVDATVTTIAVNPPSGSSQLAKPASNVHDFSMLNGKTKTTIPFELVENHVYLNVKLNGKGPFRFIYDTGGANIVDPEVAKEIGAFGKGSLQGGGVGSTTESVSFANVDELQVGDAVLKNQLFGVAPTRKGFGMSGGQPVDGLIGFEVLARFITTFDYGKNQVVLQMPENAQTGGADVIPFVLDGRQPQYACTIDGITSQCTLDTGSRSSISLMSPFMAAHPDVVPQNTSAVGVNGFGFGGPAMGKLGRLQSYGMGKYTLQDVVADFTSQEKGALAEPSVAANVGGGIWKRFALTLDYYKQTMALTPNDAYNTPDTYERAGLFLLNNGGKYIVIDSRPGTAAAKAGIVKGDTITTIDGKPASSMSLQAVRELFFQAPGTVIHMGLTAKDGTQRTVDLVLTNFV